MAQLEVTCSTKRPARYEPHERIEALGGIGWYKPEEDVIREIESGATSYGVSLGAGIVSVVVGSHQGRRYLKTTADGYAPDNLLALPDCRR
jgi:Protein of unknown function (DUF3892)